MPLLWVRKEIYHWLVEGKKTIDVRRGEPRAGDIAVFQCGPLNLRIQILKRETGLLEEIITAENFRQVIPIAEDRNAALTYLRELYAEGSGVFTAYYLALKNDA